MGTMERYYLSGWVIEADLPLHLPRAYDGVADHAIRVVRGDVGSLATAWKVERVRPDEHEPWLSMAELPEGGYRLRAHGRCDFRIDAELREIVYAPRPACDELELEHLLVDQLLPQLFGHRGQLSFHASAVCDREGARAVGFLGPPGAGKSTLAAYVARDDDACFLADDCLVISGSSPPEALPSYAAARLCNDAAHALDGVVGSGVVGSGPAGSSCVGLGSQGAEEGARRKIRVKRASPRAAVRLVRLWILGPDAPELRVEEVGLARAVAMLAEHLDRLDPYDRTRMRSEFERLERLVQAVPVGVLHVPRDHSRLDEVSRHVFGLPGSARDKAGDAA